MIPRDILDEIRALARRRLTPEEASVALANRPSAEQVDDIMQLRAWFLRRYPTFEQRSAYATRKYREWTAGLPPEPRDE